MATYKIESSYSETVVRSAVAWTFPADEEVSLRAGEFFWIIETGEPEPEGKAELLRNINEMRLRELIDEQTSGLRKVIVQKALANLYAS